MQDVIYCCKIVDHSTNPALFPELLCAGEWQFSSYEDKKEQTSYHTIYCDSAEDAAACCADFTARLPEFRDMGLRITEVATFELKKEDWSEVWKKYFHVIEISSRLVIKPSWREYHARPDQVVVEIDPGMSFGTGQHATTAYCLKMIDRLADGSPQRFLDAGCGSGILSLAAFKLGYDPVDAFDIDPDAVRVATENLAFNHLPSGSVHLRTADLDGFAAVMTEPYDLVAANILGQVLIRYREVIGSFVKPGGNLILAGILNEEFPALTAAFTAIGFTRVDAFSEKEWTSGLFHKTEVAGEV
ncbi:MAG: 50S ribosomal protein L11 methyltransferase [Victivallales bacterium]|nr:50S ribosomal protein L11 methyltransferase [Victivallales bacterium]